MTLHTVPVSLAAAAEFVQLHHRHHGSPRGHKFSVGLASDGELVGVIVVGRPVARHYDNGLTLEVVRCCVAEGIPNGCSMLYGTAWRAAKALGYQRLITYTQQGEGGGSLRAAGWTLIAERTSRKGWDTPTRRRTGNGNDGVVRYLWEVA